MKGREHSRRSTTSARRRSDGGFGRLATSVALVAVAALTLVPASASALPSANAQSVASSDGGFAWALSLYGDPLPDGRLIDFYAYFSHPEGAVAGTLPLGDIDLRKPFGYLQVRASTPPAGPGTWGSTEELCRSATNVSRYSTGEAVPSGMESHDKAGIAWTGVWFDIECDAGLGYDHFRVHFDRDEAWPLHHLVWVDEEEPARVDEEEDFDVPWINEHHIKNGHQPLAWGPSTPALPWPGTAKANLSYHFVVQDPQSQSGWGGPIGSGNPLGELIAQPLQRQYATARICGHSDGEEQQCWKTGTSVIYPASAGMSHTVYPTGLSM